MALRTFRSNPSLGGFGSESTAHDLRHHYLRKNNNNREGNAAMLRNNNNNSDDTSDHEIDGHDDILDCDADAFSQIIKELVDNAVDACCMVSSEPPSHHGHHHRHQSQRRRKTTTGRPKASSSTSSLPSFSRRRVRVEIRPYTPPPTTISTTTATNDASSMSQQEQGDVGSTHDGLTTTTTTSSSKRKRMRELLLVTVTDNGVGMTNIQNCVDAFRSSKANSSNATVGTNRKQPKNTPKSKQQPQQEHMTAGRYGIGLTLCLLHAQRLVPDMSTSISSATATAANFTRTNWVVDTERDLVTCVEERLVPKAFAEESGTSVSLLVPVRVLCAPIYIICSRTSV